MAQGKAVRLACLAPTVMSTPDTHKTVMSALDTHLVCRPTSQSISARVSGDNGLVALCLAHPGTARLRHLGKRTTQHPPPPLSHDDQNSSTLRWKLPAEFVNEVNLRLFLMEASHLSVATCVYVPALTRDR
jgi:hypothetical protein